MKVLLLNGSPNEKGCTYTALIEVAETLEQQGIETEIMQTGKALVRGCTACGSCYNGSGRCVFNDDCVNVFLEKMETADGLIIGSPVYFAAPNGALLALLDRAFYAGKQFAYKPAAAVTSARRAGTTATLEVINKYFTLRHMPVVASQYWNMVHGSNPDQVRQDLEGMQIMRTLGRNMAWLLKCLEAGKKAGVSLPEREEPARTDFITN